MANFLPLKQYIHYCLDKLIDRYGLKPRFLDVGCGIGDVSSFLARRGWTGKAIDVSADAIEKATRELAGFDAIVVEKRDLFSEEGQYHTVLLFDIVEHLSDDVGALKKVSSLLLPEGHVVIAVPSNPRFWGWDDEFYGHVRRYTPEELQSKLGDAGFEALAMWDFTFPVFFIMRQLSMRLIKKTCGVPSEGSPEQKTLCSGLKPEWQKSFWVSWLERFSWLWGIVYYLQFKFFKHKVLWGHEMIVLAKKRGV